MTRLALVSPTCHARILRAPRPWRRTTMCRESFLALSFASFQAVVGLSIGETEQDLAHLPLGHVLAERPALEQEVQCGDHDQPAEGGATAVHALPGDQAGLRQPPYRRLGPAEKIRLEWLQL